MKETSVKSLNRHYVDFTLLWLPPPLTHTHTCVQVQNRAEKKMVRDIFFFFFFLLVGGIPQSNEFLIASSQRAGHRSYRVSLFRLVCTSCNGEAILCFCFFHSPPPPVWKSKEEGKYRNNTV